jgi:trimeric autotransporter adhesin
MNKNLIAFTLLNLIYFSSFSQGVGIGTSNPDNSSILDLTSISKGFLIPRMNIGSINAITSPAKGLLVYDSVSNQVMVNVGIPAAPDWRSLGSSGGNNAWKLDGNAGTNPGNQFIGTTDNQPLRFRVNDVQAGEMDPETGSIFWGVRAGQNSTSGFSNIAIGTGALKVNTEVANLVAIGDSALFNNGQGRSAANESVSNTAIGSKSLFSNTRGAFNTATGSGSLFSNTSGTDNSAYGAGSMFFNTVGEFNTAMGVDALGLNTSGSVNTAIGWRSLHSNSTGNNNVATGWESLFNNSIGHDNTGTGSQALFSNASGSANTGVGSQALFSNTSGEDNTAVGTQSLFSNKTGSVNTAIGFSALFSNTTGNSNMASGVSALFSNTTGSHNTATGFESILSNVNGDNNTASGFESLRLNTSGSGNSAVGATALFSNISGNSNTAVGNTALTSNSIGNNNTAIGTQSLAGNSTGSSNTAGGFQALFANTTGFQNTAIGTISLVSNNSGSSNTAIGFGADVSAGNLSNATAIGEGAIVNASNKIRLGNSAVTVIEGQVPFTTPSDGRFKYKIKEDVKGLDFIMRLRPVTYQFDVKRFDEQQVNHRTGKSAQVANHIMQASYDEASAVRRTGFIAQEVERAANTVGYNFSGIIKPKTEDGHYSLSYESFVVPLVKAVQEQEQLILKLERQNEALQKRLLAVEKHTYNNYNKEVVSD